MHRVDGDSALLGLIAAVGILPPVADLTHARVVGGLGTLGLIAAATALVGLGRRAGLLWRTRLLRRALLARGRLSR